MFQYWVVPGAGQHDRHERTQSHAPADGRRSFEEDAVPDDSDQAEECAARSGLDDREQDNSCCWKCREAYQQRTALCGIPFHHRQRADQHQSEPVGVIVDEVSQSPARADRESREHEQ